jgi:hypothetical protein
MGSRAFFAVSLALALSGPAVATPKAVPKECPRAFSDRDEIVKDLSEAPTCQASLATFTACAGGASGDVEYGDAVTKRCESDFVAKLNPAQKRTYEAEHKRCERKYMKQEGTMYRSFEAFCHSQVAAKYARRFGKAARSR